MDKNFRYLICRLSWLFVFSLMLTSCGGQLATRSQSSINDLLQAQYNNWQGAPYRLGGLSKKGIDCSGFVYLTFKDQFGLILPRTTKLQVKQGERVSARKLQTGDLIFFKTAWRTRHVGIYLSDGRFLHASTSKGVIISRLDNVYWKKKYWTSRRVLD
ncbi:MAG: peptidase P60 [Methylophaga sp.]|nr:MAG: peptidase P60 [Methylophaga sp.]